MFESTKIIVAENHMLTRKAYMSLLKDLGYTSVVGEAANGKELLELLDATTPDIILLDIEMPVMNGKDALKAIKQRFPELKVIMLSFHTEETLMIEYIKLGASAFLTKDCSPEILEETIKLVRNEGFCYSKSISKALVNELTGKNGGASVENKLTQRETQIVILVCEGKTNKEIARRLNIVVKTVDFHKANIYKKTNTYTDAGLYNFALKKNLISEQEH
jgi:two-component system, NarL family, nitrate/nitrite response regulator NarL